MSGYAAGAWNGVGLQTTSADSRHGLGYADGADGVVAGLGATSELIKFTWDGDADLSGFVDSTDLNIVLNNYNKPVARWDAGDFDYSGFVDSSDLNIVLNSYNATPPLSGLTVPGNGLDPAAVTALSEAGVTVVPEPGMVGLFAFGSILLATRRRNRRI